MEAAGLVSEEPLRTRGHQGVNCVNHSMKVHRTLQVQAVFRPGLPGGARRARPDAPAAGRGCFQQEEPQTRSAFAQRARETVYDEMFERMLHRPGRTLMLDDRLAKKWSRAARALALAASPSKQSPIWVAVTLFVQLSHALSTTSRSFRRRTLSTCAMRRSSDLNMTPHEDELAAAPAAAPRDPALSEGCNILR